MKRIFAALLRLYPQAYRDLFGPEILNVFGQAASERRARGKRVYFRFLLTEFYGAALGAAVHWMDIFTHRSGRPISDAEDAPVTGREGELLEARKRVEFNLRRMQRAIAKHDFIDARNWSMEDLKAREHLRSIRRRYGIAE